MNNITTFHFHSYDYDVPSATATLRYAFDDRTLFEETFTFVDAPTELSPAQTDALDRCLRQLHLAAGVSYYKLAVPPEIVVDTGNLAPEEAAFFEKFYVHGLAEFAYTNHLDLRGGIRFPVDAKATREASEIPLAAKTLIPVGGGKDSIVSVEALRPMEHDTALFMMGSAPTIMQVIERAGYPAINVKRKLPEALHRVTQERGLTGHVPITGILSFLMVTASVLYDFDTIVLSNESSANEGNVRLGTFDVNHQYSKSFEFEQDFTRYIQKHVLANISYFSLLRPLSELGIASVFATLEQYHDVFISCNAAFRTDPQKRAKTWCADCPKCRFVFLVLAPFMQKEKLVQIFGSNMLDDPAQLEGYRELLGLTGHKPFECVGEIAESQTALATLATTPIWAKDTLVQRLSQELANDATIEIQPLAQNLILQEEHAVPSHYLKHLDELTRTTWEKDRTLGPR